MMKHPTALLLTMMVGVSGSLLATPKTDTNAQAPMQRQRQLQAPQVAAELAAPKTDTDVQAPMQRQLQAPQVAAELAEPQMNAEAQAPMQRQLQAPVAAEVAPPESPRFAVSAQHQHIPEQISNYFDQHPSQHQYIQLDKPLYKPGETLWFKTWHLNSQSFSTTPSDAALVELLSPKGAVVLSKHIKVIGAGASNDFELPATAQGGEYRLRFTANNGQQSERAVLVSAYEAPRIKKKLEFIKKAYGAGDQVNATLELKRPTGEVLAAKTVVAVVRIDGVELTRLNTTTNAEGGALIRFELPTNLDSADGLLSILIEDGGVTESISKAIPLLQKRLALSFYPEGGKMVAGLPTRLYFEAQTPQGKPADISGRLVDDRGNSLTQFSSYKNGLGRIDFTPATNRNYHIEISRPSQISEHYSLPMVEDSGCVLRSYDDFDGQADALRVAVRCSQPQRVIVVATVRNNLLDLGSIDAGTEPGVIYLRSKDPAIQQAAGVTRITVLDQDLNPLAERLVFRNRRAQLAIQVKTDKDHYSPRDRVSLSIQTQDPTGKPVPAELALSVVDDTLIAFADDKTGHMLSSLLLEPELPGPIDEPNFYTDLTEAQSALALDLLMGVRGYRRFDWLQLWQPVLPPLPMLEMLEAPIAAGAVEWAEKPLPARQLAAKAPPALAADDAKALAKVAQPIAEVAMDEMAMMMDQPPPEAKAKRQADVAKSEASLFAVDKDFARAAEKEQLRPEQLNWAPVRVFPVPRYQAGYQGPRNDYRDTLFWAPQVKTDAQGQAQVEFVLSDAVSSFRIFSEGVGAGAVGRDEHVLSSSLPFSLAAKLPLEVSAGDTPLIPVTLSNDSDAGLEVDLHSQFGPLMQISQNSESHGQVAAGQRHSLFIPLQVTGTRGLAEVKLSATAGGFSDQIQRNIPVVPVGFPQRIEHAGQVQGEVSLALDLSRATAGSIQASVRLYTSPLSTMISGLEGLLREPSGCFEQTSSTHYPNIMIMQYLKQHQVIDLDLQQRTSKLLDSGYHKLTGYESPKQGYEWFGGDPGHEALTAYGLLEFSDMQDVYTEVDRSMLARTANWLKSRRDGKGGYLRDAKALDSFGQASTDVTNAYITWALVAAKTSGLDAEIAQSVRLAATTQDAYLLALTTDTLLSLDRQSSAYQAGQTAAKRLAQMQDSAGAWLNADHSITRSGGHNLQIETTSLAIIALLKSPGQLAAASRGIQWLAQNRSGFGQWGATQATVLALKAMIAFDNANRVAAQAGSVSLLIDGKVVASQSYPAGQREAVVFSGFESYLSSGQHQLSLKSSQSEPLPYSIAIDYSSQSPNSSAQAPITLSTKLASQQVKMGETLRLTAVLTNTQASGQPMTLARLGLPGGLSFQNWQLKQLREQGQIAFFETRAREVIFYFRDLKPNETKTLNLDLVANVPGHYSGPASSAYLYYNDTNKSWAAPVAVDIQP